MNLEQVSNSRQIANLVEPNEHGAFPIVRTTTKYNQPSQLFTEAHKDLIRKIYEASQRDMKLNNAMLEVYTSEYSKMKFHTDQALDLADNSHICLFSCYENEQEPNPRILRVKEKATGAVYEIILDHHSIIVFSTQTNASHLHKIVADPGPGKECRSNWLGITFRQSKTYVERNDHNTSFVATGKPVRLATDEERKQFFMYKKLENEQSGYVYPDIDYTLSIH